MIMGLPDNLNRDLVILHKGDTVTTSVDADAIASGWSGGQFLRWVDAGTGQPVLTVANGRYCGFAAFGSNEAADQWTGLTKQNIVYGYVVLVFGGNFFYTRTFETYGYMARHGLGPATLLVYEPQMKLYVSENGKITPENESDQATYPAHNFSDGSPIPDNDFVFFGICAVPPSTASKNYMAVQTNFGV